MKIQDVLFIIFYCMVATTRRSRVFLIAGFLSMILAIPLFALWVFFTAERLIWYGAAFIGTYAISQCIEIQKEHI